MTSLSILDAFLFAGCTKSSNFERVMIARTHTSMHDGGFFIFPQKSAIKCQLLLLGEKNKSSNFPIMAVCANNQNSFKVEAFGTTILRKSI